MFKIIFSIFIVVIIVLLIRKQFRSSFEHYRDPIFIDRKKLYYDMYTRSNGSIYGYCYEPWDMFSGFPVYPKAY